jgi:glutathione S-transferase
MKLYYSNTSPYVRKVMVVAHERGLIDRIETLPASATPVNHNGTLAAVNPLGKVPALVLEDGTALYDSPVIAEYLDALDGAPVLLPASGPGRWAALRQQAAADGLLDASILIRYERALRPAEKQWEAWVDGQMLKIRQTLDGLEQEAAGFGSQPTIGTITVACALAYLDFRFAEEGWRTTRPALAAFYETFAARTSMVATAPPSA